MIRYIILLLSLSPAVAHSQEATSAGDQTAQVFDLQPANGDPVLCKNALRDGKVLWSSETGTYIAHEYHLVRFELVNDKLLCIPKFMAPE